MTMLCQGNGCEEVAGVVRLKTSGSTGCSFFACVYPSKSKYPERGKANKSRNYRWLPNNNGIVLYAGNFLMHALRVLWRAVRNILKGYS
jgi:hypothetical protein